MRTAYEEMEGIAYRIREEAIADVLRILERGCPIRDVVSYATPLPSPELCDHIRRMRERLIDRDIYEQIYGPIVDADGAATPETETRDR